MKLNIEVPFRGNRDYLHSTDIYTSFTEHIKKQFNFKDILSLRMKFNRFANFQPEVQYWEASDDVPTVQNPNCHFWLEASSGKRILGCFSDTNKKGQTRIEGCESDIVAATTVEADLAMVQPVKGAETIELVVFATKKIHNRLIPLKQGKWIVAEFRFNHLLKHRTSNIVAIRLKNNLGNRITESSINIGRRCVGSIFFMASK